MGFSVRIRQTGQVLDLEDNDLVLEMALVEGIDYPHGCQSGNCGACKSRLYAGEVELEEYSEFALTDDERAAGLVLACRSMPRSDIEIGWLELDETVQHPMRKLTCTVAGLDLMTHDIRRVRLAIADGGPYGFSAGQYASVAFAGQLARDYSMANPPGEDSLEFHVRAMEGGSVSHYVLNDLKIGDSLTVEGPMGLAYLREFHTGPILALAGGSGLAPIKAIVETALIDKALRQPIHMYFGVRDERDLYLEEHFRALAERFENFSFQPVLSEPSAETARRTGFLHDAVAADFADLDGWKVYLAGPPVMVEAANAVVKARGVRSEDLHADPFYSAHELAAQGRT